MATRRPTRPERQFQRRYEAEQAGQQQLFPAPPPDRPWRLSPLTRWNGRVGVALCRAVLDEARRAA